jgi:hypothetical protein
MKALTKLTIIIIGTQTKIMNNYDLMNSWILFDW